MANVGTIDRGLRFAAGAVLMVAPLRGRPLALVTRARRKKQGAKG